MYTGNLGAHYDGNTHTYTIPGNKIGNTKIVVDTLVNAIRTCIPVVNNGGHEITISHKHSGLSLVVEKSDSSPVEQEKALITGALNQLKKPGIDNAHAEYRKKLVNDINETVSLSEKGASIQGRIGRTCYTRDTKASIQR